MVNLSPNFHSEPMTLASEMSWLSKAENKTLKLLVLSDQCTQQINIYKYIYILAFQLHMAEKQFPYAYQTNNYAWAKKELGG